MNALYSAIHNHFSSTTGSGFYKDVSGQLYPAAASQEATFPYCTYFSAAAVTDIDFTDEREDFLLQFDIYSRNNSPFEAGNLLESLKTMFDNCSLTVTGWNHLQFQRKDPGIPMNDYSQVPPIMRYKIEYDVLLEKQRS